MKAPTKVPNAAPPKMAPAELVARLFTVEAFVVVLAEAYLDRDDVSDEKGKALIRGMRTSAKALAKQLGHADVNIEIDNAVDNLIDVLTKNLPAMKGEFGMPDGAAGSREKRSPAR